MKKIIVLLFVCSTSFGQKFFFQPEAQLKFTTYSAKKDWLKYYLENNDNGFRISPEIGARFFKLKYDRRNNGEIQVSGSVGLEKAVFLYDYVKLYEQNIAPPNGVTTTVKTTSFKLHFYPYVTDLDGFMNNILSTIHLDFGIAPATIDIVQDPEYADLRYTYYENSKINRTMSYFGFGFRPKLNTNKKDKFIINFVLDFGTYTRKNSAGGTSAIKANQYGFGVSYKIN